MKKLIIREVSDVRAAVAKIKTHPSYDYEVLHSMENDLYEAVLRAIVRDYFYVSEVAGYRHVRALARAALKTKKLKFRRVTA